MITKTIDNRVDSTLELDVATADSAEIYTILSAELLLQGDYSRSGDNLIIQSDSGEEVVVEGYFLNATPPILQTPAGAALLPETVQQLIVNTVAVDVAGPADSLRIPGALGSSIGVIDDIGADANVTAKGSDGSIRTLKAGDSIYQGDVVETVGRSYAGIRMNDDTSFQLGKETRAVIDNYKYDDKTEAGKFEATVTTGFFRYASGKLGGLNKGTHSTIKTPTAQIGIRGSELEGQVDRDGSTTFVHKSGILDVSDVFGRGTVTLTQPGTATAVSFKPGAPSPIFEAPEALMSSFKSSMPSVPQFVVMHREEEEEEGVEEEDGEEEEGVEEEDGEEEEGEEGEGEEIEGDGEGEEGEEGEGEEVEGEEVIEEEVVAEEAEGEVEVEAEEEAAALAAEEEAIRLAEEEAALAAEEEAIRLAEEEAALAAEEEAIRLAEEEAALAAEEEAAKLAEEEAAKLAEEEAAKLAEEEAAKLAEEEAAAKVAEEAAIKASEEAAAKAAEEAAIKASEEAAAKAAEEAAIKASEEAAAKASQEAAAKASQEAAAKASQEAAAKEDAAKAAQDAAAKSAAQAEESKAAKAAQAKAMAAAKDAAEKAAAKKAEIKKAADEKAAEEKREAAEKAAADKKDAAEKRAAAKAAAEKEAAEKQAEEDAAKRAEEARIESEKPIAENDSFVTKEETAILGNVASNDKTDGSTYKYSIITDAANGKVTLNADGSFTYSPEENYPTTPVGIDTFTYQVINSNGHKSQAVATIDISPTADTPTASAGATLAYTENGDAAVIDNTIVLTDVDDTHISSAVVTISSGFIAGDILHIGAGANSHLSIVDQTKLSELQSSVNISYNSSNGVLVLSGDATLAEYQLLLRNVSYQSTSEDPTNNNSELSRTISWSVTDANSDSVGAESSIGVTSTINITPTNDAPVASNNTGAVYENSVISVSSSDSVIANDTDVDSHDSHTVTAIRTGSEGDSSGVSGTVGTALIGSYGTLTIQADGAYSYSADQPAADSLTSGEVVTDTFSYTLTDSDNASTGALTDTAELTISITGGAELSLTGTPLEYTENGAATVVDNTAVLTDINGSEIIVSAEVQVSGNYHSGEDLLSFSDTLLINSSWNSVTGILTLTGSDTAANYQAALKTVQYHNSSEDPNLASRTISYRVNDGVVDSSTATQIIHLTAVNDTPIVSAGATLAYTENGDAAVIDNTIALEDVDDTNLGGILASSSDIFNFTEAPNNGTLLGSAIIENGKLKLTSATGSDWGVYHLGSINTVGNEWDISFKHRQYGGSGADGMSFHFGPEPSGWTGYQTYDDKIISDGLSVRFDDYGSVEGVYWKGNSIQTASTTSFSTETNVSLHYDSNGLDFSGFGLTFNDESLSGYDSKDYSDWVFTFAARTGGATNIHEVDDLEYQLGPSVTETTIAISSGFTVGDELNFTEQNGISVKSNVNGVLTLTGVATIEEYQAALRTITFENSTEDPTAGGETSRTITWTIVDANSDGVGAQTSSGVTSTINLTPNNDAPIGNNDTGAVNEDSTLTVAAGSGVISNDTDQDSQDTRSVTAIRTGTESAGSGTDGTVGSGLVGTYGTLTLNSDGSYNYVADKAAANALISGETETDTFTYTISDSNHANTGILTDTAELSITVTGGADVTAISHSGTGSGSSGEFVDSDVITITATFDEVVNVTTTNGTPALILSNGAKATYASGTGTNEITFSYTVSAGDNDATLLSVRSLTLNGGAMTDVVGGTVSTQLTSANFANVTVDATAAANFSVPSNGLKLWLSGSDASTITKDSDNKVSQWNDKSSNNYNIAQSTDGYKPIYDADSKSIVFDGSDDYLWANLSSGLLSNNATVIMEITPTSDTGAMIAQGYNYNGNEYGWIFHRGKDRHTQNDLNKLEWSSHDQNNNANGDSVVVSPTDSSPQSKQVAVVTKSGTTVTLYKDNADITSSDTTVNAVNITYPRNSNFWVGQRGSDVDDIYFQEYFKGNIHEIVVYDRVLSSSELTTVYNGFSQDQSAQLIANFTAATDDVGTVTGTLSSGNSTDDTALALSGTNASGSIVNVYNGTTFLGAATVNGANWSYNATIADGTTYQFNMQEISSSGAASAVTDNFTVVGDTTAPTATSVTYSAADSTDSNSNGTYENSDVIAIKVAYDEVVSVVTTGGTPSLVLSNGGSAVYASGTGTDTLTFNYTVSGGNSYDVSNGSLSVSSLSLNSGTITDAAGNSASTSVTSIAFSGVTIDPVVLDLNGDGIEMMQSASINQFAMIPDGTATPTNWLSSDDGFLALDVNNNGKIDNITELFSEYFAEGINTGLGALSTLDENSDGIIDQNDSQFANLQIWQDFNQDGISTADELKSLADHGIESFDLNVTKTNETLLESTLLSNGSVGMSDGTTKSFSEVAFAVENKVVDSILVAESIDLSAIVAAGAKNIEQINMEGNGSDTLSINLKDVLDITDSNNLLFIDGDADDQVIIENGWQRQVSNSESVSVSGYEQFSMEGVEATLYIDEDINQLVINS